MDAATTLPLGALVFQLFLLIAIVGGLALWHLKRRIDATARRQSELDLELVRLRRLIGAEAAEDRAAPAPVPAAEAPAVESVPEPRIEPEAAAGPPAVGGRPLAAESPVLEAPAAAPEPGSSPAAAEAAPPAAGETGAVEVIDAVEEPQLPPSPPTPTPTPSPPPSHPSPPLWERIDWERWIGVRGAAVLGGAVLALAAILFLKFSIERGLISPPARVALGVLAGLGAIGGAELLRKRAYATTANALSGAGIVILYASVWAAHRLYGLAPFSVSFAMMVLVTAACGLLSWRYSSRVIAMLGLLGGFATPLLLTAGPTSPIGLFGYILVLDVGLLVLARQRGWPIFAGLSLAGTLFYQALWIFGQMGPDRFVLTLVILAVFAALFAVAGGLGRPGDEGHREKRFTMVGGLLMPFAFATYLAARADLGEHVLPIASLLLLLAAAACWMGRVHGLPLMAPGSAAASVAVIAVWAARTTFGEPATWEAVGVASALATLFHFLGREESPARRRWTSLADFALSAPLVAAAGLLVVLLLSSLDPAAAHLWPWALGWLYLGYLLTLQTRDAGAGDWRCAAAPLVALAEVGTVGGWLVVRPIGTPLAWEAVTVAVVLAAFFHLAAGARPNASPGVQDAPRSASFLAATGLFLVLGLTPLAAPASGLWPWLAGWTVLAALLLWRGGAAGEGYRQSVAAFLFGASFLVYYWGRDGFEAPPRAVVFFALAVAVAIVFQALALARRRGAVGFDAEVAGAIFPATLLLGLLDVGNGYLPPGLFLAVALLLAVLVALSATRLASGGLYLGAAALLAAVHSLWTWVSHDALREPGTAGVALAAQAGAVLVFTFWPFAAERRLAANRWALYGSALAGPLWFLSLRELFEHRFGSAAIGLLPVALAVAALVAAWAACRFWPVATPERRRALVWYLAVAFLFISVAIPLQLEKEWITVGWALQGLALIRLWKRFDHPGLKYLGLALLAAATLRLLANPAVLGYYPRSGQAIFNWLMYTYLVPATTLITSAKILAGREVERLLGWESGLYELFKRRALGAVACGLSAILVGFWWVNLTVIDYFSVGRELALTLERLPARDLTLSLCWALYALLLLAVGMARRSVGLRWLSLGFLVLTIGKVFLYDLGELQDLYRVASLVGLAISLLLVSLAYQRFVFGRDHQPQER